MSCRSEASKKITHVGLASRLPRGNEDDFEEEEEERRGRGGMMVRLI